MFKNSLITFIVMSDCKLYVINFLTSLAFSLYCADTKISSIQINELCFTKTF